MSVRPLRLLLPPMVLSLFLAGCASVVDRIPYQDERLRARNEGYSLLYQLAVKNSDVDKILIVKHTDENVSAEIKAIAETYRRGRKQLEKFAYLEPQLNMKMPDLPKLETETRAAIEKTTTKRLLFATGKDFERELLVTQLESTNYAAHLASVLKSQDDVSERREFLNAFAHECEEHWKIVMRLLSSL